MNEPNATGEARPLTSPLGGAGLGALWGIVFEAAALLAGFATAGLSLDRVARMLRIGEIALLGGGIALVAALLASAWKGKTRVDPAAVGGVAGLSVCLWASIAFLFNPPAADVVQFSSDPIALRTTMFAVATVCVAALAFTARRFLGVLAGPRATSALALIAGLLVAAALAPGGKSVDERRLPDIFLITVDTLRADHLGCYGYPLPTSPEIDRLCGVSMVFERAMTSVPETVPAYASMLTGLSLPEHGVFNNFQTASDDLLTFPEQLRDAGYFTAAILQHSFPGTFRNLDQGFDLVVQRGIVARTPVYTLSDAVGSLLGAAFSGLNEHFHRDASVTTDAALRWIRDLPRDRPLFLHVYWAYPHLPYEPPPRYESLISTPSDAASHGSTLDPAIRRYDAEVRFADTQVGRILDAIEAYRDFDGAWIVFTADHGEELGRLGPHVAEPYFGHSLFLYDSSLHVPLVVHPPSEVGLSPGRSAALVDVRSIAATLLAAAGQTPSPEIAPALVLAPSDASTTLFSVMRKDRDAGYDYPIDRVSARSSGWRLVETRLPSYGIELLRYRDGEATPAALGESEGTVEHFLEALHERFPPGESAVENLSENLPPEEVELLRSLGYLP